MDPFATLGVEPKFDLDLKELEKRHRELSRALHPDKFASAGATERKISLTKSADVNEAWRMLRDPVRRAEALFVRAGFLVGDANEPKAAQGFLMEMLDQREALEEAKLARDANATRTLGASMETRAAETEKEIADGFARAADANAIAALLPKLGELRFYRRFLEEVAAIDESLESH